MIVYARRELSLRAFKIKKLRNKLKTTMEDKYYISETKHFSGARLVHIGTCRYLPKKRNRFYLGELKDCHIALQDANRLFMKVQLCPYCCMVKESSLLLQIS